MKRLICILLVLGLAAVPAFAGTSTIVNSVKYEVSQKSTMPYPAIDIFGLAFIDPDTGYYEKQIPIPGKTSLVVDGTFLFHTKFSTDADSKLSSLEGNISSLGASAVDELGNKYLLKGDYRFNYENFIYKGKYIEATAKIPLRLVDANSGHEYVMFSYASMVCEPSVGCTRQVIYLDK